MIPSHSHPSFYRFSEFLSGHRFVFVNALGLDRVQISTDIVLSEGVSKAEIDALSADLAKESFEKAIQGDERLARNIPSSLREQAVASIREDLQAILGSMAEASSMGENSARAQMVRLVTLTAEMIAKRVFENIGQEVKLVDLKVKLVDLKVKVNTDPLTGLFNRRVLEKSFPEEIERSERTGQPLCVMIVDLDEFKGVNDNHGHLAGDGVLKEVASRLQKVMRSSDVLVRVGGDEFIVLCPNTDEVGALFLAHRIIKTLKSDIFVKGETGTLVKADIGASIGVGMHEGKERDGTGEGSIKKADDGLYILKGAKADKDGKVEQRRGQIAIEGKVFTHEEAERIMQKRRESEGARQA